MKREWAISHLLEDGPMLVSKAAYSITEGAPMTPAFVVEHEFDHVPSAHEIEVRKREAAEHLRELVRLRETTRSIEPL